MVFIINRKKSLVFSPQQCMKYLGVIIDSTSLEFSFSHDKIYAIIKLFRDVHKSDELETARSGENHGNHGDSPL